MAQVGSTNCSSLPGIVTDQPEIYESEPVLSDDTGVNDLDLSQESSDEAIALIEVPIKQAFSYFAERESEIAQFYVQRHGEYKISGSVDEESDIEKYHRLVSEVNELSNKFNASKVDNSEISAIKSINNKALTNNLGVLTRQLKALQFAAEDGSLNPTRAEFIDIESRLKNLTKRDESDTSEDIEDSVDKKMSDTARIVKFSALERRLSLLENVIGHSDSKAQTLYSLTNCQSLSEASDTLGSWLSLLYPENVQKIKREVDFLNQKLEAINERFSQDMNGLEPKAKARLDQLCDLITSTEKHRAMIPTILHRLNAMEELQQKAAQVAMTVSHLEQVQSQILESLQSNKEELDSLNKMFGKNMELIKEYSDNIDNKITDILKNES